MRLHGEIAVIATADFFTPVVDDPFDWGRIAAANALSDIYAMGGRPLVGVNLLAWPRDVLPSELAREVLRGGLDVARSAGCHVAGGHSIDDPEPKYGMAVTGIAEVDRLLRNDAAQAGLPLSLSKPLGVGVLNSRHKSTGERFAQAVECMASLNREAAEAAVAGGVQAATDVTGFGLLGHLYKMCRASGVSAVVDAAAVPYLDGAREAARDGFISGGTRRNLDWVQHHVWSDLDELELLLLADAQTSGGLLVVGEVPGAVVIGELVAGAERARDAEGGALSVALVGDVDPDHARLLLQAGVELGQLGVGGVVDAEADVADVVGDVLPRRHRLRRGVRQAGAGRPGRVVLGEGGVGGEVDDRLAFPQGRAVGTASQVATAAAAARDEAARGGQQARALLGRGTGGAARLCGVPKPWCGSLPAARCRSLMPVVRGRR